MSTRNFAPSDVPLPLLCSIRQLWALSAVLVIAGLASLPFDVPLARLVHDSECPLWLMKLGSFGEMFAHGLGVLTIVILIAVLDPAHRFAIPRIVGASLGAGLLANGFKLLLGRIRPAHFDLEASSLASFQDWLPLMQNPSSQQSFPSSHAATAAGLAIVMTYYYPRGRWLFPVLAAAACMQRVQAEAHFLSDTFWGTAVGCLFAPLCVYGSPLAECFRRLEVLLKRKQEIRLRSQMTQLPPMRDEMQLTQR